MVFTILVAADVHGTKINYEVDFFSVPTMPELHRRITDLFATDAAARRPPGAPTSPFTIQRLQVFDEKVELWVELLSSSQLQEFCQVYVFQPETAWHKEVQSKLPAAVKPAVAADALMATAIGHRSPHHSPVRARSPAAQPPPPPVPVPIVPAVAPPPVIAAPPPVVPRVIPPVAPAPLGHGMVVTMDNPSHDDKVRAVFDELDTRKARAIELDEWRATFTRLRIELGVQAVADLYQKADANHDGVVSFDEFLRFSERYPTLLDALFCRAREFWVDVRQKEGIDAARRLLESLRSREADARASSIQATAETNGQELKLQACISEVAEAEMREREQVAVLTAAQQDTEQARAEVAGRVANLAASKEKTRAREVQCIEAARDVERADALLRAQDAQTMAAEERMREIERMLEDARRECEAQRVNSAARRADIATAQGHEQAAHAGKAEADREVGVAADRLGMAEAALVRAQERERECGGVHLASREETARRMMIRDAEERELAAAREKEAAKKVIEAESTRAVEAQDRMAQALENENIEHNMVRLRVEDEERPLLEQEVRLREQRESLEQMEFKLRSDHGTFQNRTQGRAGVVPSPRRVPVVPVPDALHVAAAHNVSPTPRPYLTAPPPAAVLPPSPRRNPSPRPQISLRSPATAAAAVEAAYAAAGLSPGRTAYDASRSVTRIPPRAVEPRTSSPRRASHSRF